MLFLINQSPFNANTLANCSQYIGAKSEVLLIENGVYAAIANSQLSALFSKLLQQVKVYALQEDVAARGLTNKIMPGIALVNYQDFVELTVKHEKIISWS